VLRPLLLPDTAADVVPPVHLPSSFSPSFSSGPYKKWRLAGQSNLSDLRLSCYLLARSMFTIPVHLLLDLVGAAGLLFATIPCATKLTTSVLSPDRQPNDDQLYSDEDGSATEESQKHFSVRTQNIVLGTASVAGTALGLAVAVLSITDSKGDLWPYHSRVIVSWLQFGIWVSPGFPFSFLFLSSPPNASCTDLIIKKWCDLFSSLSSGVVRVGDGGTPTRSKLGTPPLNGAVTQYIRYVTFHTTHSSVELHCELTPLSRRSYFRSKLLASFVIVIPSGGTIPGSL